jgi:hypothetical protein
MMESGSFSQAIEEHLELRRRNGRLETRMPLSVYRENAPADASEAPPDGGIDTPKLGGVPPEIEVDPSTASNRLHAPPWDDPESWWSVGSEPSFTWGD